MRDDPHVGWDVHTHLIPSGLVAAARRGELGMTVEDDHLITGSARVPLNRIARPDLLVERVEKGGLDGAVVSPPPPLFRADLDAKRDWADEVNHGMDQMCDEDDRLLPVAYLPTEAPELAAELAGSLDDDWAGVILGTDLGGLTYSNPRYKPLWSTLQEKGLVGLVHPAECSDPRLDAYYLKNLIGNPYETTVAAAHLLFGGVLDDHPDLELVLAHGGGAVASLIGRWEHGHRLGRTGVDLESSPREAVRRFTVDTVVHDPTMLSLVVEVFGQDRLVFGSDWPFPMGDDSVPATSLVDPEVLAANSRRLFS